MNEIEKKVITDPYNGYIYSYPHKKSYRYFSRKYSLKEIWEDEVMENITLYLHIPFCKKKCAYCNLLSTNRCNRQEVEGYLAQLKNELKELKNSLCLRGDFFSELVIGGGTPLFINDNDLDELLKACNEILNLNFEKINFVIEGSPDTLTYSKMKILKKYSIKRVSIGVQSFVESELKTINREHTYPYLERLKDILISEKIYKNLDLIYGIPEQTLESFKYSLKKLMEFNPEEIFLYPLYIREFSPLKNVPLNHSLMMDMYQMAVKFLTANGYYQASMRNFVREDLKDINLGEFAGIGNKMIGVGCGARSYTSRIHYCREYFEKDENVKRALEKYIAGENVGQVYYGIVPSESDWQRRALMRGLLNVRGVERKKYQKLFGHMPEDIFPQLKELEQLGFVSIDENFVRLTATGLMYSDSIGNLFISPEVRKRMDDFDEEVLL